MTPVTFLLDTNVLSEFAKPRVNPGLFDWIQRNDETLPAIDTLLAAVALNRGLILVTRNTRDFERTGVNLLNPWT